VIEISITLRPANTIAAIPHHIVISCFWFIIQIL
jgi:hypothetical protein